MRTEYQYALSQMRTGPYYDIFTKSLRIPHRTQFDLACAEAASEWEKRKFQYDAKRKEYFRTIQQQYAFDQVAKARAFYFALYQIYNRDIVPTEKAGN